MSGTECGLCVTSDSELEQHKYKSHKYEVQLV